MASSKQWQKLTAGWTMEMVEDRMKKIDRLIDGYNREYLFLNNKLQCMENEDLDNEVDVILTSIDYEIMEEECGLSEGTAPFDDEIAPRPTDYNHECWLLD